MHILLAFITKPKRTKVKLAVKLSFSTFVLSTSKIIIVSQLLKIFRAFKTAFNALQPSEKAKIANINSETLLRGNYLLLQKSSTKLENLALPNHLQLSLFVPLPLPNPGSAPGLLYQDDCSIRMTALLEYLDLALATPSWISCYNYVVLSLILLHH